MSKLFLQPVEATDFEDFKNLRKAVMREHVDRQKLPWIEEAEDAYHAELFAREGLHRILWEGTPVGYIGINEVEGAIEISRFVLRPAFQKKGIGTQTFAQVFSDPRFEGKKFILDVLKENYAQTLFQRVGFVRVNDDGKLVAYERPAPNPMDETSAPRTDNR